MIEKIIKEFENAKPEEIKRGYYNICEGESYFINKGGFKFKLRKYSDLDNFCMPTLYEIVVSKNGKYVKTFESYPNAKNKVEKYLLEKIYNNTKKKVQEYKEQKEKIRQKKNEKRRMNDLEELEKIL